MVTPVAQPVAPAEGSGEKKTAKWILIYDGDCEFCRRQIRLLERWDVHKRIEHLPFQEADLDRFGLTREAVEEAMHLVAPGGETTRGAQAAREVLGLVPRGRALTWLFRLPGAMPVAEHIYRWVAKRRHRFGCGSEVCRRGSD